MFFKKLACWLLKMKGTCGFALIFRVMAPEPLHSLEGKTWHKSGKSENEIQASLQAVIASKSGRIGD
jgi:hypothetical protein